MSAGFPHVGSRWPRWPSFCFRPWAGSPTLRVPFHRSSAAPRLSASPLSTVAGAVARPARRPEHRCRQIEARRALLAGGSIHHRSSESPPDAPVDHAGTEGAAGSVLRHLSQRARARRRPSPRSGRRDARRRTSRDLGKGSAEAARRHDAADGRAPARGRHAGSFYGGVGDTSSTARASPDQTRARRPSIA